MISFEMSEITEQIRTAARKFTQEEIAPGVIDRDVNSIFPSDILHTLGELGFMGMMVQPEYGGSGLDTVSYIAAIEEFSKVEASVGTILSVHNSLVNWIVEYFGNDFQKEKYLTRLASGEFLGAFSLSEPEAGSDATRQHTIAVKDGKNWLLTGTKNWVTSGSTADIYIVFAQTNKELGHKGISCFLIEKDTPGFSSSKKEDKMGLRSSDTCSLGLLNAVVPEDNLIGGVGGGFRIAMESLNGGRIGIAAQAVGIAQAAYEASLKYSQERHSFGKPICEHQLIQQKLARMATNIEAARLLTYKAAWLKDTHQNYIQASAMAKLFATTIANDITREAIQIHGGYGYVREYQVERFFRDAKVTEIYEGTSEIQHIVIARELLKNC